MRFFFKTSSVTPDIFHVFNIMLSFSTCSQSLKKSVRGRFWARITFLLASPSLIKQTEVLIYLQQGTDSSLKNIADTLRSPVREIL